MYCELTCGRCEAHLQMDTENEDGAWLLVLRYAEAHVECGFVTPAAKTDDQPRRRVVYRDKKNPPGETV